MYADDTQLYIDFSPEGEDSAHAIIAECVKEIKAWLSDNFLLLNENKAEAITVIPVNQSAVAKSIQLGGVTIPCMLLYIIVDFRHKPWCSIGQKV